MSFVTKYSEFLVQNLHSGKKRKLPDLGPLPENKFSRNFWKGPEVGPLPGFQNPLYLERFQKFFQNPNMAGTFPEIPQKADPGTKLYCPRTFLGIMVNKQNGYQSIALLKIFRSAPISFFRDPCTANYEGPKLDLVFDLDLLSDLLETW